MDRGRGRDVQRNQTALGFNVTIHGQGTRCTAVSEGGFVIVVQFCFVFVFHPPSKADKRAMAVGGSKGRVREVEDTQQTPKHFISITNNRRPYSAFFFFYKENSRTFLNVEKET